MGVPVTILTLDPVTVEVAGNARPLSPTPLLCYAATVQSLRTNAGYQYIGDADVSSANGAEFGPSDTVEVEAPPSPKGQFEFDLNQIYVDSTSNNSEFRVTAWIKVTNGR